MINITNDVIRFFTAPLPSVTFKNEANANKRFFENKLHSQFSLFYYTNIIHENHTKQINLTKVFFPLTK